MFFWVVLTVAFIYQTSVETGVGSGVKIIHVWFIKLVSISGLFQRTNERVLMNVAAENNCHLKKKTHPFLVTI